ncbi:MAG TPA: glycosyltransferase [Acidobacteriaceae bacterium]|nr:glycosyltransferase [Acidobacteriaceae bacterium]
MKIVHVVDSMEVGGAETLVAQMCRLQREQGHDPEVYAIAKLGALGERMRAEGFRVEAELGRKLIDSSLAFLRLFRAFRPDVVHLHNPTPTIYAAPAARLAGTASIISTRHSLVAPPRNHVMERKYALAARFCDWIVGICDATVNNVKEVGSAPANKIVRIYNGAVPVQREHVDHWPAKRGFTLLFVGRLEPVKNLPLLLAAVRDAVKQNPDIQLWILGDGTQRASLEDLSRQFGVESNVTFWGQQLEVGRFFSAADAFVMSSVSEGLPMSLLQAFSIGLPAIVTDVGGMAEVVRFAGGGEVVPVTDNAAMTAAVLDLAANPQRRKQFSVNAAAAYQEHFTLAAMVDAYLELYRNTPRARRAAGR